MANPRKLIVVLGAHRSGTSLCAAATEALGADVCLGEHYANEENRKGFFEHPDIVAFNNALLAELGGSWDNPLFDGAAALADRDVGGWRDTARDLVAGIYGEAAVAVIKDPRICQLLPFWDAVLVDSGYARENIFYLHTLRNPVEVALSQQRRAASNRDFYEFGRRLPEGAALWFSLTAQSLLASRDLPVFYLSYEALLTEPQQVLPALAGFTGLQPDPAVAAEFCDSFVDPALYRSSATEEARSELARAFPELLELWGCARELSGEARATLPGVIDQCRWIYERDDTRQRISDIVAPAFSRLSESAREDRLALTRSAEVLADCEQQVAELKDNGERMQAEHQQVVSPLRDELANAQQGTRALRQQLDAQESEIARLAEIAEANRLGMVELNEQKSQLETETLQLSGERDLYLDQRDEFIERVRQMENSTSWKLTRPLRSLSFRLQRLRDSLARNWVQFRLKAILVYHRMSLRHPGVAWTIRRLVRPVFRLANRLFGVAPRDLHTPQSSGLLSPMLYQQREATEEFAPLVSVIVPNYNHADYLELRLESIFSQTYEHFEVILLDDASTDASADLLRKYHQRYPDKSTLVINEENSGGVFHQWERGLNLARGDIVWIAESDDWCTENFLATLVPYFENEAIMLAYARTVFMDGEGERQIWSINEYLHDIDPQRWNHTILATGPQIVREAFAVKNIVPNVSSALFRTPRQLEILADPEWRQMKTCGDWVLYLHLLRGGMLAYSPEACNYYRIHGENTSVGSYSQDAFYREHELVARTVQRYFEVPDSVFETLRDNLEIHWRETRGDYSDEALESCFSLARIAEGEARRAPNLLMASYAFCSGGGETFPVSLANIMKGSGYNVTYLDCDREPRLEGVRRRLRADIPIVSDFSQLERIIADFDIEVIHSHHAWMDSTILDILPEDVDCKTVVTLHGMYETINEYDLKPILPRLVKRSARLIYVAEKNLDAIRRHQLLDYARLERIDNALELADFEPLQRSALGIPEDAFVLTLVSRAMEEKGWREAIEVVDRARRLTGRDLHLLLVGDGPEYDRLKTEALPAHVHLEGFQRNVRGYFAVADLGFLPSKFRGESFPLVIIECLQSGVPFLATELGEIARMLDGPQGMAGAVVPLDGDKIDIPAMVDLLTVLLTAGENYKAMQDAVPGAAGKFDPAILASKHDAVYRAALEVTV
ncbi:glycosyltransferase [Seongchinamella unica]|uniref:Glycosyltransferase n=1 Tax=Seongchinamella unica TaxID=2547392 RepID=A0A4R5LUN0_9GAMM|nr:glycosyltransferase [Seongchinamella unica]TDG15113.1 glycosyltransferase [Seongchinamella unica]